MVSTAEKYALEIEIFTLSKGLRAQISRSCEKKAFSAVSTRAVWKDRLFQHNRQKAVTERARKATRRHKYQMDPIMEVLIDLLTHRVDVYVLRLVSGGQFIWHSVFA